MDIVRSRLVGRKLRGVAAGHGAARRKVILRASALPHDQQRVSGGLASRRQARREE